MTIRKRVLGLLRCAGLYLTAAAIKQILDQGDTGPAIKLSSLSSVLKRMYDAGELERIEGFGPRGGYGYKVKP